MAEDLTSEIEDAAEAPRLTNHDGVITQERSLGELIEADKYLSQKRAATKSKTFGIRFAKIVPPGAS